MFSVAGKVIRPLSSSKNGHPVLRTESFKILVKLKLIVFKSLISNSPAKLRGQHVQFSLSCDPGLEEEREVSSEFQRTKVYKLQNWRGFYRLQFSHFSELRSVRRRECSACEEIKNEFGIK